MRKLNYGLLLLCLSHSLLAQRIGLPYHANRQIDGQITAAEKSRAWHDSLIFNGSSFHYYLSWDSCGIYVAYEGPMEANFLFPELLLSPTVPARSQWLPGSDWFFHLSATLCESTIAYGRFDNCAIQQIFWQAAPLFAPGPPLTSAAEIVVDWRKIGFNPHRQSEMAGVVIFGGQQSAVLLYPNTAALNAPFTWAIFELRQDLNRKERLPAQWEYGYNQALARLWLHKPEAQNLWELRNSAGKILWQSQASGHHLLPELPGGVYFLCSPQQGWGEQLLIP